ncbi:hypothetical protein GSF70_10140 [Flavobacteriaceae bacterium W22]|nr:hypothetical protein [Flavobacteriaceae bacterium W22]
MKILSLLSPHVIKFEKEDMTSKISHQMYTENKLGTDMPVNHAVLILMSEKSEDGRFKLPIDGQAIFGKESAAAISQVKTQMGRCSQLAENLFSKLKALHLRLKYTSELKGIFDKYEEKYKKLDFMGHRKLFSEILQSNKIDWIKDISDEYDVKSLTKTFYNFIMDRNKYTHGELMLYYPSKQTIIEYEDVEKNREVAIVNAEIITSYTATYNELNKLIDKIEAARQKKFQ